MRQFRPLHPKGDAVRKRAEQVQAGTAGGGLLIEWLRLIGWKVRLEGDGVEAVAEHLTQCGERLVVRVRAAEQSELAGLLFERAMASLEASRARSNLRAEAA